MTMAGKKPSRTGGESGVPAYLIPRVTPEAAEYFAGTVRGELRIQRCSACRRHHHYPRVACPHCGSSELVWITASGLGTLHSFTVIRQHGIPPFKEQAPFVVGLVDLDEPGARFIAQMSTLDVDEVAIGMRVRASFKPAGDAVAFVEFERDG